MAILVVKTAPCKLLLRMIAVSRVPIFSTCILAGIKMRIVVLEGGSQRTCMPQGAQDKACIGNVLSDWSALA